MRKTRYIASLLLTIGLLSMASEQRLAAYTDPGSGAMVVQIVFAAVIGGLYKIRRVFSRLRRPKDILVTDTQREMGDGAN